MAAGPAIKVGLISDTHGLLRPEAVAAMRGCRHIIHAGDIGAAAILESLTEIAPVTAVRGNCDQAAWAKKLPETELVEIAGVCIYVIHDLAAIDLDPAAAGIAVVVCGHSHAPRIERQAGVLFVNPGSAGPRRFCLPVSAACLTLGKRGMQARLMELLPAAEAAE